MQYSNPNALYCTLTLAFCKYSQVIASCRTARPAQTKLFQDLVSSILETTMCLSRVILDEA